MQIFEQKIGQYVDVKGELVEAKLKLSQEVSLVPLINPVLDKLKEIIPGHFDDALIDAAKAKIDALLLDPAPAVAPV